MDHAYKPKTARQKRSRWGGAITAWFRREIIKRDGPNCWLCGKAFEYEKPTLDHVIPRSKGGNDQLDNLKIAHMKCNTSRGNATASDAP